MQLLQKLLHLRLSRILVFIPTAVTSVDLVQLYPASFLYPEPLAVIHPESALATLHLMTLNTRPNPHRRQARIAHEQAEPNCFLSDLRGLGFAVDGWPPSARASELN